jgi:hypothetical protein
MEVKWIHALRLSNPVDDDEDNDDNSNNDNDNDYADDDDDDDNDYDDADDDDDDETVYLGRSYLQRTKKLLSIHIYNTNRAAEKGTSTRNTQKIQSF